MKVGKPKSKRTPVRLRHKIEKASAAKQRKQRKEAKTNPQWRSRLKKDPGIPNLFPYKAKLLAEIEEGKRRKEEEVQKKREIAKAQRLGKTVGGEEAGKAVVEEDGDEELLDTEDVDDAGEGDEMEVRDESNPMAALLASAQARASAYTQPDDDEEDEESDDDEDATEWAGIDAPTSSTPAQPQRKALPKQALADPIKAVTALIERMQNTQNGIQRLLDHYDSPPLVTAGKDFSTRFLVEVARKRGRLGRGGVPNLHSAALTVLGDLNEERLQLPAVVEEKKTVEVGKGKGRGEVRVVSTMAAPFRIEGLFGDKVESGSAGGGEDMVVET